ncbi:MAG TPA: hypothetical protein VK213_00050 [Bacteroidales bacterium]|nr:hypothetical protein [Bacteroidales bacterium]
MKPKEKSLIKSLSTGILLGIMLISCEKPKNDAYEYEDMGEPFSNPQYTTVQTISDEAQGNTIAFDALGFMTGNFGSQTFLPPGKVADYSGFQYFRDNDPTKLGHNTSFVTIIAGNILDILTADQLNLFVSAAKDQIDLINQYAYKRYPLCKAFRRLIDGDLPVGTTGLNKDAVLSCSADLYKIDGEISYNRAELFSRVVRSLTVEQAAKLKNLRNLNGIGNWPTDFPDKLKDMSLSQDISVAVMTFASEIYSWWAGSVAADVYFCPERQGTYFGSFYLKDWPAMGNPNYTIDEQLTANAGQNFLNILTTDQKNLITGLVTVQKTSLLDIVDTRENVSIELRKFLISGAASSSSVQTFSQQYGRYDGEIIYAYATAFSQVFKSMSTTQKAQLTRLAADLGYINPTGAFLYSAPVNLPNVESIDFLFK